VKSGFVVWDKTDRKPVGAPPPVFPSKADAATYLSRLSDEDIDAGRYEIVAVPE
jgi:hypothetical protein